MLQKPEEEEQSGQGEPRKPSHRANPAASLSISVPPSTSTGLPSALSSLLEAILALAALWAVKQIGSPWKGTCKDIEVNRAPAPGTRGEGLFMGQEEVRLDYGDWGKYPQLPHFGSMACQVSCSAMTCWGGLALHSSRALGAQVRWALPDGRKQSSRKWQRYRAGRPLGVGWKEALTWQIPALDSPLPFTFFPLCLSLMGSPTADSFYMFKFKLPKRPDLIRPVFCHPIWKYLFDQLSCLAISQANTQTQIRSLLCPSGCD